MQNLVGNSESRELAIGPFCAEPGWLQPASIRAVLYKTWWTNTGASSGCKAAIPVLQFCDLPAPKRPLATKDQQAAMSRAIR